MAVGGLAGCSQGQMGQYGKNATDKQVSVLYAGSMTKIMEDKIKPDFDKRTNAQFEGEGKGSDALAQMIKSGLSNPDVFISASPDVNTSFLMGNENHNLENWYITLASDQLVIAYSPKSRFKADFEAAKMGSKPWYEVLQLNGLHFGRTDPELDPKGVNTLFMFQLAQNYYHKPGLSQSILKSAENTDQVFPEETLVTELESGQTDAIIVYKHEAVEWGMPYISLPDEINLGSEKYAKNYQEATYTQKNGQIVKGSPILFTATILNHAKNPEGAATFLQYLESGNGAKLLLADGFTKVPISLYGKIQDVPTSLAAAIKGPSPS
jgi:molybdate/tungstate transport system substrate-binding protein